MNRILSGQARLNDPTVRNAYESALRAHAIDERHVVAAFAFGSRAKGHFTPASDMDFISFVNESSPYPDFEYRRVFLGSDKIDSNAMKFSALNELCRADVDWAYRLHLASPLPVRAQLPEPLLVEWAGKVDAFIESAIACRLRFVRHVRECRSLLRAVRRFENEAAIASYLATEAVFLLPIVYLNHCRIVPYQHGLPWNEASRAVNLSRSALSAGYKRLTELATTAALFQPIGRNGPFAEALKTLREDCRTLIRKFCGDVFRDGYGAVIGAMLDRNPDAKSELSRLVPDGTKELRELIDAAWNWLNLAREAPAARRRNRLASLSGTRRPRSVVPGIRHIQYDRETLRLKVIIPTGGCRVPTCTFCMLPSLAHSKASFDDILDALRAARSKGPVRQLTVYTDGSFFDDRELSDHERALVAAMARECGAAELLVESLPRFLNDHVLGRMLDALGTNCRLRVGIGIQSSDPLVRRYVTGTPISQGDIAALLELRLSLSFSLRIYLLANKPMMSATEDRRDLHRTLELIGSWLTEHDIVTVNPLLPTHGTLLEGLWRGGFWQPLRATEARALELDLRSKKWDFHLEMGPSSISTCTDVEPAAVRPETREADPTSTAPVPALPWALLGGMRQRNQWLKSLNLIGRARHDR
jgi:radical SAM enzyme (TIGR01210 family)